MQFCICLGINEDIDTIQIISMDGTSSVDDNLECKIDKNIVESSIVKSRKRVSRCQLRQTREKKGKSLIEATKLTQPLCSSIESGSSRISNPKEGLSLIYRELIELLETISEIEQDNELYIFALDLFKESKDNVNIFMSLKSNERRVEWLKYEQAVERRSSHISQPKEGLGLACKELIEMMETISEIEQDNGLYFFALRLFKESIDNRQVFWCLSNEKRVGWLKYERDRYP